MSIELEANELLFELDAPRVPQSNEPCTKLDQFHDPKLDVIFNKDLGKRI